MCAHVDEHLFAHLCEFVVVNIYACMNLVVNLGVFMGMWASEYKESLCLKCTHTYMLANVSMTPCVRVHGVVGSMSCTSGFMCILTFVCQCAYGVSASPHAPGGTQASVKYKEQRNNLHNLAFDLCCPESSLALTAAAKLFPSPVDSILELCLPEASASPCPHKGSRTREGQ